ncbi:MAG: hypothetical protein GF320_18905 [Armatimonadia bacterium]|nr:hypothetical protein [Armatimonadia bacterium]
MAKIDLKREMKDLYSAPKGECTLIEVPELQYLMIDGKGNPNEALSFQEAVAALYGLAFTIKMSLKRREPRRDWVVPPLQGLWWSDDMEAFVLDAKDDWYWTLMVLQPDFVTQSDVEEFREVLCGKKNPPRLDEVRFETYEEGLVAQTLHVGPYSEEAPTVRMLHAFIDGQGLEKTGCHHEIYLGDPRRTAPDRLKTILRQPVSRP